MSTGTEYDIHRTLVEVAVEAIKGFAGNVDRHDAEYFLGVWPHRQALDVDDWAAVLDRFGAERELVPGSDFLPAAMPGSPAVPADSYERTDAELDGAVVFDDADGYGIDGRAAKAGAL